MFITFVDKATCCAPRFSKISESDDMLVVFIFAVKRFGRFFVVAALDFHGGHNGVGFQCRSDRGSARAGAEVPKASLVFS